MADAGTGRVGSGVAALSEPAGLGHTGSHGDAVGMPAGSGSSRHSALAWFLSCPAAGPGVGISDFRVADRRSVCEFLVMVASSGLGFAGLPGSYLGRCPGLSNTAAGLARSAELREVANKCPCSGCRLRCRRWTESTSFGLPQRTLRRDRIQLALALGGSASLPVGAGSIGRYLARRLASLRPGLPVSAPGNDATRRRQGARRNAPGELAGQLGICRR